MFSKKKDSPNQVRDDIDTLIGENLKIIGRIEGSGNIRIDGSIEGDIDYDGDIVIGESGTVVGNVTGQDICLAGRIEGNVSSKEKLSLLPSASLKGDIHAANLVVHENAKFDGSCQMSTSKDPSKNLDKALAKKK